MSGGAVLLLGFEPFKGFPVNSSWESVKDFEGRELHGRRLFARRLPVSYGRAGEVLDRALAETRPEIALAFGVHGGSEVRLERVAVNADHEKRPDNDGAKRWDAPILPGQPPAMAGALPLDRIERRLKESGFPAKISFHAGTYLCNHVYFLLMQKGLRAGFIHVPPLWSLRRWRGWSLGRLKSAVRLILDEILVE
ncbi:MAG TPA: pyroglutamyl-peptidase I [Planctomycetota bacterium]|nr:pyroglutamyl-peptidase I [Planctomycetota bacterium]